MEEAKRKQTIFNSKPLGVTAWIFLGNNAPGLLKTVSMYWRTGFAGTPCMPSVAVRVPLPSGDEIHSDLLEKILVRVVGATLVPGGCQTLSRKHDVPIHGRGQHYSSAIIHQSKPRIRRPPSRGRFLLFIEQPRNGAFRRTEPPRGPPGWRGRFTYSP